MKQPYTLPLDDQRATLDLVGGKGASLAEMVRAGLPVPGGFHVTTAAYHAFVSANHLGPAIAVALEVADPEHPSSLEAASAKIARRFAQGQVPPEIASAIVNAYGGLSGSDPVVAVRSSATAEDLPQASFAGQQESFLNIHGAGPLLDAVKHCWASLWTARAIGYRARHHIPSDGLGLAVVVQCLVPAEAAGILFTANPVNGRRDQVLISAAWGLGEAVVGGEVTPDSYTVDKRTGRVVERETADKQTMVVRVEDGTEAQRVPQDLRHAPVLDDHQAAELAQLGGQIEELYGDPRDIEWALADGQFAILQARPITALPEPMAEPPQEWPLPDPKGHYMRTSITDFTPDPLTPLFATMAIPAVGDGIHRVMEGMIGGLPPEFLRNYLVTINDYAYLNASFGGRDVWWMLVRMVPAFPRLLINAARHWEEVAHPHYADAVTRWEDSTPATMSASELLAAANALTRAMGEYLTTLQVDSLGIAAGTEMLFTGVYDKLIKRKGDPEAATYLLGSDSLPIQAEKALYDLAQWCRRHDDLAAYLRRTSASELASQFKKGELPAGVSDEVWGEWTVRLAAYLDRYGHSIYDLDFAKPIPADDPTPLLQTLKLFVQDEGRDPHARQQHLLDRREEAIDAVHQRTGGIRRWLFDKTHGWAQTHTRLREDSIFEIGLAYRPLRAMLLELGRRLADEGAIPRPEDVFWLESDEAEQAATALDRGQTPQDFEQRIAERRTTWRAEKQATPPAQLPYKERILGFKTDVFMPAGAEQQSEEVLKGVGCSPGQVTGIARVIHGPEDFDQMQPGDILVADITTPAWTPLFALASGIVTDIGGPLSHGSIVAREYGIPSVLGTGVATKRIESGQRITVDGGAGTITLSGDAG